MSNSCFVVLRGLRFHSSVGVMSQELRVGNDIVVDLRIGYPFQKAMTSDDVADTLNYAEVFGIVKEEVAEPAKLLERLGGRIAKRLQETYPQITSIDMKITKLNPPMGADSDGAGVEIHLINTKTDE